MVADEKAPLPQRISRIEIKVFGSAQIGSLLSRVDRLNASVSKPDEGAAVKYERLNGADPVLDESVASTAGASKGDVIPLLNAIPPNFLRMSTSAQSAAIGPDYIPEVTKGSKGKVLRFKAMPIPVFITTFPDKQFISCVVRGFETWEGRTDGAVRFVQVDNAEKARIQVVWKRLGHAQDADGCTLGAHTITKYTEKGKGTVSLVTVGGVPVPVYIPKFGPKYTVPPQMIEVNLDLVMGKSPTVRYRLLQNVVTHELGHALGLLGHSQNVTDMMYSVTDEHSRLSERDVNTLKKLYQQKLDVPL